jgi:hypothetical protein
MSVGALLLALAVLLAKFPTRSCTGISYFHLARRRFTEAKGCTLKVNEKDAFSEQFPPCRVAPD